MAETSGIHVAILAIGEAGAVPDDAVVIERLRAAGHNIITRASVDNFVPVVRRQLAQWVGDANVDVVIAIGGGDDNVASSALTPLVTQPLPGFGDVFRMLVFQSLGSVAVIANAEAARCTKTVVFLLPAFADAVKLALDKLIVPQLDVRTEPSNLARLLLRRGPGAGAPPDGKHIPSVTAPPSTAPARTTPPPFRKTGSVVAATPPVGVVVPSPVATEPAAPEPAAADPPAATPAPDKPAAVSTLAPSASDNKVVIDIETLGVVVESEDSANIRAVRDEAAATSAKRPSDGLERDISTDRVPVAITKPKHARDPDATDRVFVIKSGDLSRRGMFGKPRTQIGPVAKALAALALLALGGAAGVVIWSRLGTRRVAASNQAQAHRDPVAMVDAAPSPPPVVENRFEAPIDAPAVAASDIDIEPAAPPDAAPAPHDQQARPDRSDRTRPVTPPRPLVDAGVAAQPPGDVPVTTPSQRPEPVTPVTPTTSANDGCDEVTCVLDSYARACCEPFKPKAPSQHPGLADSLDRAAVQDGVKSMRAVVIACGERFKAHGQVRIALVVAPDGHVTSSTVELAPDEGLGACVAEAMRRVQFKQTVSGGHFTYPYAF